MKRQLVMGLAIDPKGTWMHEDTVWVRRIQDGYCVDVTIADPTGLNEEVSMGVAHGDYFKKDEAKPWRMIPYKESNEMALNVGRKKPGFTISIPFDEKFRRIGKPEIGLTRVHNQKALHYGAVSRILKDPSDPLYDQLLTLARIANKVEGVRSKAGATALVILKGTGITDKEGVLKPLPEDDQLGYLIVAEFMMLANALIAQFCFEHGIPILYSNYQMDRDPETVNLITEIKQNPLAPDPMKLKQVRLALGLLPQRIIYSLTPTGNDHLRIKRFTMGTAPLRRTVAFVNAYNLVCFLRGDEPLFQDADLVEVARVLNGNFMERAVRRAKGNDPWIPPADLLDSPIRLLNHWAANIGLNPPKYRRRDIKTTKGKFYEGICLFHGYNEGVIGTSKEQTKQMVFQVICNDLLGKGR